MSMLCACGEPVPPGREWAGTCLDCMASGCPNSPADAEAGNPCSACDCVHPNQRRCEPSVPFDAQGSFQIKGRGMVLTGPYPFDCPISDAIGRKITVDAVEYEVRGVEWGGFSQPKQGQAVGILVR